MHHMTVFFHPFRISRGCTHSYRTIDVLAWYLSVVQQKCIGNCVEPMIKFGAMALVSFQLKKNIPYTVCIVLTLSIRKEYLAL